jgi:hypothetical protein
MMFGFQFHTYTFFFTLFVCVLAMIGWSIVGNAHFGDLHFIVDWVPKKVSVSFGKRTSEVPDMDPYYE